MSRRGRTGSRDSAGDLAGAFTSARIEMWPARPDELTAALTDRLAETFAAMSADDALALLTRAPRRSQDQLRRVLGLPRGARKLNRGMASTLLSKLRSRFTISIPTNLVAGFLPVFDASRLDLEKWVRLLTGTDEEVVRVTADSPELRSAIHQMMQLPIAGRPASLLVAALLSENWVPALALAAVEQEEIAALYESLRQTHEDLPVALRTLDEVVALAMAEGSEPEVTSFDHAYSALAAEATDIDWEGAALTASRVSELLDAREAPGIGELESLDAFVRRAHDLAARLTSATQSLVDPTASSIAAAIEALDLAEGRLQQIAALLTASAPGRLDAQLEQVRQLAESAVGGNESAEVVSALAALAELADIGQSRSESTDFDVVDGLLESARAGLPADTHRLTDAALHGRLLLGTHPAASPAAIADADTTAGEVAGAAGLAEVGQDDGDPGAGDQAGSDVLAPLAVDAYEVGGAQAGQVGELHEEQGTALQPATPDESAAEQQADAFDVAAFDRFLEGSAKSADHVKAGEAIEAGEVAEITAETEPTEADDIEELLQAETVLIKSGRFGAASLLHRDAAHAAARRLAAYQAHLTSSTGDLASAFAGDQPLVTRDALSSDQSGQLLAWAAAARVSILAPASGAVQVLLELARRVDDYPGLKEFGSELATASLNGAIAILDRGERMDSERVVQATIQGAVRDATDLLAVASQRTVKYAPANNVYKRWMAVDGQLGELLADIVANRAEAAGSVQAKIVDLRRSTDKLIDDTFALITSTKNRTRRIEAGARQTLIKRMDEALDIAAAWAEATIAAAELRDQARSELWSQRPLEKLRSVLPDLRRQVADDFERLDSECDLGTPVGRQAAAAISAAARMIDQTFAAIDGQPPRGKEPSPAWVVRGELLALEIALDARTLQPLETAAAGLGDGALEHDAAVRLSDRRAAALDDLYRLRADRGEHDLTEVIVHEALRSNPETGALLVVQREHDVQETEAAVESELQSAVDVVNSRRREETLPEQVWSTLLADLAALSLPGRRDFAVIRATIKATRSLADKERAKLIEQEKQRIAAKAQEDPRVAEHRGKLEDILARGDIPGAEEYLERLTSREDLPAARDDDRHLRAFFPAVPELAAGQPRLLDELRETLNGQAAPTGAVQRLFEICDFDPEAESVGGRSVAQIALGAWRSLASSNRDLTALRSVLAALGLEYQGDLEVDSDHPRGRQFGTLRSVHGTHKAMTPALGSHMGGLDSDTLRVLLIWRDVPPSTIVDWLAATGTENTVLVLYLPGALSPQQRRVLATAARGRPHPVGVVVDAAVLAYLVCQPEPSRRTLSLVTMPFTAESPYRETPGNTPEEMFFGRVNELRKVIDLQNASAFVSGGRQLGKSALLRTAMRRFDNASTHRALLIDIRQVGADQNPEAIWPWIAAEMKARGIAGAEVDPGTATAESVTRSISGWLGAADDHRLLILVDEADNFLQADAIDNRFTNVDACKRLMSAESRRVKFVFAGLHRTSRFSSLSNQPLAHMGDPIVVGPLRAQAAQDLITRPMAAMGFTFEDPPAQTARILAATNSVPSLLQLFGRELIEDLTQRAIGSGPPQPVTDEDITRVLDNQHLADLFRSKYALTLNLDHRYQVIVHTIALAAHEEGIDHGLRLGELAERCRMFWPVGFAEVSIDHLRGLVTECCDLGLLTLDDGRFRMRTPYVLRLLGTIEDIADVLYDADNRLTLPSGLDAGSYRDPIPGTERHSPLTSRQVGRLFEKPGATQLIVGTSALGAERSTLRYLEKYAASGRAGQYAVQMVATPTPDGLIAAARRVTQTTMLLVDLHTATSVQAEAVLAAVNAAHAATDRELVVVVLLTSGSLPSWLQSEDELVALSRVDRPGIELWCDEIDATFSTRDARAELLTTTGGWPVLVEQVLQRRADGRPSQPERGLADLREYLSSPAGARTLVRDCGLGGDDSVSSALAAVFAVATELAGASPTKRDELADVIGEDSSTKALLADAGLTSVRDALRALEILGALLPVGGAGDLVMTEPVLTEALQVDRQAGTSA